MRVNLDIPDDMVQAARELAQNHRDAALAGWVLALVEEKIRQPYRFGWEEVALIEALQRTGLGSGHFIGFDVLRGHWKAVTGAPLARTLEAAVSRFVSKGFLAAAQDRRKGFILTSEGSRAVRGW